MSNPIQEAEQKIKQGLDQAEHNGPVVEKRIWHNPWIRSAGLVLVVLIVASVIVYFESSSTRIEIDTSQIVAPVINLSPTVAGELKQVYVNAGDTVPANAVVAEVGDELIKTQVAGQIISVDNQAGMTFTPGQAVVTMIDPTQLRAVGTIDEDKGLDKIQVGQPAQFTVDAFGSKVYDGVVDEVSPTSNQSSVVFNISDARQTQQFDVYVRFDQNQYPELHNGMSARITIFIK